MKGFREYVRKFALDESGTAIIEWVIVLAIVACLVPVIVTLGRRAGNKVQTTTDAIDSMDTDLGF